MDVHASQIIKCPNCGNQGSGNFCSNCAAPLKSAAPPRLPPAPSPPHESVPDVVKSKFTGPLIATLAFAKTVWLLWFWPVEFLRNYFKADLIQPDLSFPLTAFWSRIDRGPQSILRPFPCLAVAIGFVAVLGSFERAAWDLNDFAKQTFGQSAAEMREKIAELESQQKSFFEARYGGTFHFVDMGHLTGVSLLDKPLAEVINLFSYAFFGLVVVLLLPLNKSNRNPVVHCYIYLTAAALAGMTVLSGLGLIVFSFGALTGSIQTVGLSGLGDLAGGIFVIYFVAYLPSKILPQVLNVPKQHVIEATWKAAVVWLVGRYVWYTLLPPQLGIIWKNS